MSDILAPAIRLAEKGFAVTPITAYWWQQQRSKLIAAAAGHKSELLLPNQQAPAAGEVWKNPALAEVFKTVCLSLGAPEFADRSVVCPTDKLTLLLTGRLRKVEKLVSMAVQSALPSFKRVRRVVGC